MKYDDLLLAIDNDFRFHSDFGGSYKNRNALLSVVDMHKPIKVGADKELCSRCVDVNKASELLYEMSPYPCETIKAIEKELA